MLLHDVDGAVSVSEAAERCGISGPGARQSLETLERLGIVVRIGSGRTQKYGPVVTNPFAPLLRRIFETEQQEYEELLRSLREAVAMPEIREAWIRDVLVKTPEALEIDVVASVNALSWMANELRSRLIQIEKRRNIIIELNIYTLADRPRPPSTAIILQTSGDDTGITHRKGGATNDASEERSLRVAKAISELLLNDSSLIRRAAQYAGMLLREGQGTADSDLAEWKQLLEHYSAERLRDLLLSEHSRAKRLRRSMPFYAVLTPKQREDVMKFMETTQ